MTIRLGLLRFWVASVLALISLVLIASSSAKAQSQETAVFAAGCFWCIQPPFDALKGQGVIKTTVGYAGGSKQDATYERVSRGRTEHLEAIEVIFDPRQINYRRLLEIFWENIDPYDGAGQFCDKGDQYRAGVFYQSESQKKIFEDVKAKLIQDGKLKADAARVLVLPAKPFYPAEDEHQAYYQKNPVRYKLYRLNCGRDRRLKEVWGR